VVGPEKQSAHGHVLTAFNDASEVEVSRVTNVQHKGVGVLTESFVELGGAEKRDARLSISDSFRKGLGHEVAPLTQWVGR
jgi:hypothetical protein